jgi:hypothetical protein
MMNFNWLGFAAAALSIVAFQLTYLGLRRRSLRVRLVVGIVAALAAIPALLFAIYYLHILPECSWFYTLRSWTGSELLVLFLGCAGGATAALLPRALLPLPLLGTVILGVVPYVKPILGPLPDSVFTNQWQGDVCLQSTSSTCGPASLCSVLRKVGIDSSERAAAHAAFSYSGGTEAWYLARYARREGCTVHFQFGKTFLPSIPLPAIVGVNLGGVGHFIAVLALNGDTVTLADPLIGKQQIPLAQFQKQYVFTGFHMAVSKR